MLTFENTNPLNPNDYIYQVLAPETAIMLISQDRGGISHEVARNIMEDSLEFGFYVHDIDVDDEYN